MQTLAQTESRMTTRAGGGFTRGGRGFTLLELLVAVGIAALLAVAVAGVFDAVGKTVGSGRRLSELNVYAAMVEQTMRRDFENMAPEAMLVIRNERSNDGQQEIVASLAEGDPSPRVRRMDEVMFISRGKFVSQREPIDQNRVASATTARVYYGNGKRRVDTATNPPAPGNPVDPRDKYRVPFYTDDNYDVNGNQQVSGLGQDPGPGANYSNPNRFASDWCLLRHVTLLCPPSSGPVNSTHDVFSVRPDDPQSRLLDSDRQYALQPAASSISATLSKLEYNPPSNIALSATYDNPLWLDGLPLGGNVQPDPTTAFPSVASGVIDIATTDLEEIRTLLSPHYWSNSLNNGTTDIYLPRYLTRQRLNSFATNPRVPFLRLPVDAYTTYTARTTGLVRPLAVATQAWMLDMFPAASATYQFPNKVSIVPGGGSNIAINIAANKNRTRVRFEPEPPALLAALTLPDNTSKQQLQKTLALTDQAMLTRFNFLPRCTEFIVEWSLGEVYGSTVPNKAGQTVWYGLRRGNGVNNGGGEESATVEGPKGQMGSTSLTQLPEGAYPATITQVPLAPNATFAQKLVEEENRVRMAEMIHGGIASGDNRPGRQFTLESFFGQALPVPDRAGNESQAWVWPKYVRVTMSFVSERDPLSEQTYQVVFPIPKH